METTVLALLIILFVCLAILVILAVLMTIEVEKWKTKAGKHQIELVYIDKWMQELHEYASNASDPQQVIISIEQLQRRLAAINKLHEEDGKEEKA